MAISRPSNVTIEGARLLPGGFKNFSGRKTDINPPGKRNFCVALPEDLAEAMARDGWNVKYLEPRPEDDPQVRTPFIKVGVNFSGRPPRCVLITSAGQTMLGEEEISMFDYIDMAEVDLILNPYVYDVLGNQGISAYLQTIYVTLNESELDKKYAHVGFADKNHPNAVEEAEFEAPF